MKAEFDHAGRIHLTAETGAESHALRLSFAGNGAPVIADDFTVAAFHNIGKEPVSVSFRLLPQGSIERWTIGTNG